MGVETNLKKWKYSDKASWIYLWWNLKAFGLSRSFSVIVSTHLKTGPQGSLYLFPAMKYGLIQAIDKTLLRKSLCLNAMI